MLQILRIESEVYYLHLYLNNGNLELIIDGSLGITTFDLIPLIPDEWNFMTIRWRNSEARMIISVVGSTSSVRQGIYYR